MRVLVLESDRHAADRAIRELEAAGHEVVRCHEADMPAFPCTGLCDHATCPVDDARGIDVALTMRAHAFPRPTPYEDGVVCALRSGVPLVVGGVAALNPFARWTTVVVTDDAAIVGACQDAAAAPVERLAAPARAEVRRRLDASSPAAATADVVVQRDGRSLLATVILDEGTEERDGELAVAVAGVLRSLEPSVARIDVAVQREERAEARTAGR